MFWARLCFKWVPGERNRSGAGWRRERHMRPACFTPCPGDGVTSMNTNHFCRDGAGPRISRVDLHCHTKYSDRPSEWILRRIGAPESFVEPTELYRRCRERGMNFVTVSDHNRIEGALDIAHLPGTFISSEITTYFPDNGAKVHILVTGITEEQFRTINEIRPSIYDFQRYVLEEDILYSVAHPLFRVNDRLTVDHLEKLLVMFNRFELINGARDARASEIAGAVLLDLTAHDMQRLADKHGLEPVGSQPWKKLFTGGSDDHSGLYLGGAYTATPHAENVEQYLKYLRAGRHHAAGSSGTSLRMAHSFYAIGYSYYKSRFMGRSGRGADLISELFRRLLNEQRPKPTGLKAKAIDMARRFVRRSRRRQWTEIERTIVDDFSKLVNSRHSAAEVRSNGNGQANGRFDHESRLPDDEHSFHIASQMSHLIGFSFMNRCVEQAQGGRLIEMLQTVASLGPIAMGIAPYLTAFATQHKDESFHQDVADRFESARHLKQRSARKAWITDTYDDINGVALTIKTISAMVARKNGRLTVLTSLADPPKTHDVDLVNFPPVGEFNLPEYDSQKVAFPPFLDVCEHIEREGYAELIISTPGPMGLVALAAGKLMGLKLTGIYHTDFPQYVRTLTDDGNMEAIASRFMHWFYGQMNQVLVPSDYYRRQLIESGFDSNKLGILPRGVDFELFTPTRRDPEFWHAFGLADRLTFIYVGRVSREKNVEHLLESFIALRQRGVEANLVIVGNGPMQDELKRRFPQSEIVFTGYLTGHRLATAYASADVFVFPSTTDTFGNVVLEAQASGLPAIVTDRGGPQEIVIHGETGFVVDLDLPHALTNAMARFADEPALTDTMAVRAIETVGDSSWESVLECFWSEPGESEAHAVSPEGAGCRTNGRVNQTSTNGHMPPLRQPPVGSESI